MFAKAPILAWLLTALAWLLAELAIAEGRSESVVLPARSPPGVVTYEVIFRPTATLVPTPRPTIEPSPTPCDPAAAGSPRFGCTGNARSDELRVRGRHAAAATIQRRIAW